MKVMGKKAAFQMNSTIPERSQPRRRLSGNSLQNFSSPTTFGIQPQRGENTTAKGEALDPNAPQSQSPERAATSPCPRSLGKLTSPFHSPSGSRKSCICRPRVAKPREATPGQERFPNYPERIMASSFFGPRPLCAPLCLCGSVFNSENASLCQVESSSAAHSEGAKTLRPKTGFHYPEGVPYSTLS
jgi:hypothetical protein